MSFHISPARVSLENEELENNDTILLSMYWKSNPCSASSLSSTVIASAATSTDKELGLEGKGEGCTGRRGLMLTFTTHLMYSISPLNTVGTSTRQCIDGKNMILRLSWVENYTWRSLSRCPVRSGHLWGTNPGVWTDPS